MFVIIIIIIIIIIIMIVEALNEQEFQGRSMMVRLDGFL